jgi:hypothetical protein
MIEHRPVWYNIRRSRDIFRQRRTTSTAPSAMVGSRDNRGVIQLYIVADEFLLTHAHVLAESVDPTCWCFADHGYALDSISGQLLIIREFQAIR